MILRMVLLILFFQSAIYADLTDDVLDIDKPEPTINQEASPPSKTEPISPKKKGNKNNSSKKPPKFSKDSDRKLPIHYQSQSLRGTRERGLIELKSHVVVTQGNLKVNSDDAKIHFNEFEELRTVEAIGNVKIQTVDPETGQPVKATSDKVTYYQVEHVIVLNGNAKLWRGDDLIQGQLIRYNLETGWIKVQKVQGKLNPQESAR